MHSSVPTVLVATGGGKEYPQTALEVCIESWVPSHAASLKPGVITWYERGTPGPSLTPTEARALVELLTTLIGQVEMSAGVMQGSQATSKSQSTEQ